MDASTGDFIITTVRLRREMLDVLDAFAARAGLTRAEAVRIAVRRLHHRSSVALSANDLRAARLGPRRSGAKDEA